MSDLWKYGIVAIAALLIGFSLGYIADFPNEITFDATPRLITFANETLDKMSAISEQSLNLSFQECPAKLRECEKLYPMYVQGIK